MLHRLHGLQLAEYHLRSDLTERRQLVLAVMESMY